MSLDPNALFYVAAQIPIVPEKLDEVLKGFTELAGLVEANEPGCLSYQVFHSEADNEIAVFEMYGPALTRFSPPLTSLTTTPATKTPQPSKPTATAST